MTPTPSPEGAAVQPIICEKCGEPMTSQGESETMVGYFSPRGHNHDDNCRVRRYVCNNGHWQKMSKQNSCHACDWRGTASCFCCGKKVALWPEEIKQ